MSGLNAGDTAWLLVATAMVMVMLPGLALFYGGMVRRKNILGTIVQSLVLIGLISVEWALVGYSMAFGPDLGGIIGGLDFVGSRERRARRRSRYAPTIPFVLFAAFQLMFAVITPALITGAFAERFRFSTFLVSACCGRCWSTTAAGPLGVGAGRLAARNMGALDFAGGTVVHISSGVSALAAAIVIGRRQKTEGEGMAPHDVPMTVLGAGILWFGWFGFNAGSALAASGQAANALLVTNTAAGAATITWVLASWLHKGKVSVVGAAAGAVAGLVAITPASGYVTAGGALLIGGGVGALSYAATLLRERLRVDDALDVFAVHGVGGMFGALMTGVLAIAAIGGVSGAIQGNFAQVGIQLVAVGATVAFAAIATFLIVKLVDFVLGLRVAPEAEQLGLDLALHGEAAYQP